MRSATNKYYRFGRGLKDEEAFINLLKNSKNFNKFNGYGPIKTVKKIETGNTWDEMWLINNSYTAYIWFGYVKPKHDDKALFVPCGVELKWANDIERKLAKND